MKRIQLPLVPGVVVEFADRELALKKVEEWARGGTAAVQLVFGPEGCGKTAWLRQSAEVLRELGFDVIYVNPLERDYLAYIDLKEVARRLAEHSGIAEVKLADLAIQLAKYAIKKRKRKMAVLADDVFQAIGVDKAASYVKWMLSVIEYPPGEYENIVAVVATSEGVTRREIGGHRWASPRPMWNMAREGFKQLYEQIPGEKPPFEEAWRLTGGNPKLLGELYGAKWDVDKVLKELADRKRINAFVATLGEEERELLRRALDDPDVLFTKEGIPLMDRLVDMNLIVDTLPERDSWFWAGEPPPKRDVELGIGRRVAWQTPLHREAVRRALEST